jgi:hypothetical protein
MGVADVRRNIAEQDQQILVPANGSERFLTSPDFTGFPAI